MEEHEEKQPKRSNAGILIFLLILVLALAYVVYTDNEGFSTAKEAMQEKISEVSSNNDEKDTEKEESAETTTPAPPTKPKPAPVVTETTPTPQPVIITPKQEATTVSTLTVVTYTSQGFVPANIEIKVGDTVTFINASDKTMWVMSAADSARNAEEYIGLRQSKSTSKGGSYTFTFTQTGTWGYQNVNQDKHTGIVTVIE